MIGYQNVYLHTYVEVYIDGQTCSPAPIVIELDAIVRCSDLKEGVGTFTLDY